MFCFCFFRIWSFPRRLSHIFKTKKGIWIYLKLKEPLFILYPKATSTVTQNQSKLFFLDKYVLLLTFMLRHFISCLFAGIMTTISNCHNGYNKTNILDDASLLRLLLYGNRCIQIICVFYFPNLLLSILSCNNSLRFTFHLLAIENL